MSKNLSMIIFAIFAIIFLVAILIFLQNLNVSSVVDQKMNSNSKLKVGLGGTCSTPTFAIDCKTGLTCATNKNISDFNPSLETAKCIKTIDVIDLNSHLWKK